MTVKKHRGSAKRLNAMGAAWTRCREAAGLTQAALATKLKMTGSYVSLIESGKRVPDILVITAAAKLMKVEISDLCP
jgi:transcriptional regulator with XRE-family HTH domain